MEEFEMLSDAEMASSVRAKIKSIQYQKYSLELDIIAESAVTKPNSVALRETQQQIDDLVARQAALQVELERVSPTASAE